MRRRAAGSFPERYGPWALIAGASQGIGAAFARAVAARGVSVVLVARRRTPLEATAHTIEASYGVATRVVPADLAEPESAAEILEATAELDLGLLVYNAAFSPMGPFLERSAADALRVVQTNCAAPVALVHGIGRRLVARRRGGIILMASLSALQGSSLLAAYGASKAFNLVLAEGLAEELRPEGVDVVASCAGAVRTPDYEAHYSRAAGWRPPVLEPDAVTEDALAALGRRSSTVPGHINRLVSLLLHRLLPRHTAIRTMAKATAQLYAAAQSTSAAEIEARHPVVGQDLAHQDLDDGRQGHSDEDAEKAEQLAEGQHRHQHPQG